MNITAVAVAFDAFGNIVTRPGGIRPTFQRTGGLVISRFDNYGKYGEYWGNALKINPDDSGPVTIQVSGPGAPPASRDYVVK